MTRADRLLAAFLCVVLSPFALLALAGSLKIIHAIVTGQIFQ